MIGTSPSRKGQGSTEYLVVLAIVLMVAIIAIALLSGVVSFAPSKGGAQDSQLYWQGATPFSIEESQVATENVTP